MARQRMVTRTIESNEVTMLAVNPKTAQTYFPQYTLGKVDEKDILKTVKKLYDTEDLIHVSVQSIAKKEKLYGMTEDVFLAYAVELDPRQKAEE